APRRAGRLPVPGLDAEAGARVARRPRQDAPLRRRTLQEGTGQLPDARSVRLTPPRTGGPPVPRLVLALAAPALACLLAGPTPAQEKKDDRKNPLQSFEPKSKPGAGQKFLEKFAGEWDVVKTFHPR